MGAAVRNYTPPHTGTAVRMRQGRELLKRKAAGAVSREAGNTQLPRARGRRAALTDHAWPPTQLGVLRRRTKQQQFRIPSRFGQEIRI
jgi:hypothetical protein